MKVLSENAHEVISSREGDAKRTDVQDILADNAVARCPSAGLSAVCPGLVLAGAHACTPSALRGHDVTCVVSAAHELPDTPLPHADTPFLRVPVRDAVDEDLAAYFDLVSDVIQQIRESGGCTLVHCVAGVSRSAALCLAYLMREEQLSLRDAFYHLRSKRSQIRPNTGFFRQLIQYEERLFGSTSVKIVFNEAAGKDIPDVYEADYQAMLWYRQKYCLTGRH